MITVSIILDDYIDEFNCTPFLRSECFPFGRAQIITYIILALNITYEIKDILPQEIIPEKLNFKNKIFIVFPPGFK